MSIMTGQIYFSKILRRGAPSNAEGYEDKVKALDRGSATGRLVTNSKFQQKKIHPLKIVNMKYRSSKKVVAITAQ